MRRGQSYLEASLKPTSLARPGSHLGMTLLLVNAYPPLLRASAALTSAR